jgi:hypothetical protein
VRELHKVTLVEPYQVDARTPDGQPTKRTIQPGQYKTMPNHVGTSTGEIHYYATPEETPAKMAELMAWYRREMDKGELHPLILAATFHYQFVVIHPFDDGNGRMARLLMNLIFMQAGFPPVIIHAEDKNNYLLALEQADTGDLEPFIVHIGNELINSLDLFLRGAKGEDVEEIGDLDKKLTLLEKKLEAQEAALQEKMFLREEQRDLILMDFFDPFFSTLSIELAKFNNFFEKSTFLFSKGGEDINFSAESTNILIEYLPKLMGRLSPLEVRYFWEAFKANARFNLLLVIDIGLGDEGFEITYTFNLLDHFSVIKDTYGKHYSSEQINALCELDLTKRGCFPR